MTFVRSGVCSASYMDLGGFKTFVKPCVKNLNMILDTNFKWEK